MASFKSPDFSERAAMAKTAKQSALDKLRSKPAPDPATVEKQRALAAARDVAAAERRNVREDAIKQAKVDKAAADVAVRPSEAEAKSARDARYAARKARTR